MASPGFISPTVQASLAPSSPGTVGELPQSISLTGGPNSPATSADANIPGLISNSGGMKDVMKKHWVWIVVILLVLAGLWYFSGSSTATLG